MSKLNLNTITTKPIKYSKMFAASANLYTNQPQTQHKQRPIKIHFLSLKLEQLWLYNTLIISHMGGISI
jgi:hypothetical protein